MLGVLGGMGPAATADFLAKLVRLTPARCDQEHIPLLLSSQPQTPDRSAAILGSGPSPLPALLGGLGRLLQGGARVIVIPCNSSHHWYEQLQSASPVPILHIADATLAALASRPGGPGPVAILATRGTLFSGFYQRKLEAAGHRWLAPETRLQAEVDGVIRAVKAGAMVQAALVLAGIWERLGQAGVGTALLACTELPVAAECLPPPPFTALDSNLELARAAVDRVLKTSWHRPFQPIDPP
jgi:aspartate racemase